ncbi:MAG: NAD(P)-dependent oxidoreductase [Verrucomicrobiota bacterium]|nr:NAD(P)-dependent oxidoreductase [Verrucomicrobiota bacterium]
MFPVGLLLEGQPCLIVGGGKIAARKAELLRDSGAIVTLVAPTISANLAESARQGRIKWIERSFAPSDLDGQYLAYAATDDATTNRDILRLCRDRRILCCAVDAGWRRGDFLTPAIVRRGDLTISVSTSGRACRRSRLVKESLSRHIDSISSAGLIVLGTSHEQLAVAEREPLHLIGPRLQATGRLLSQIWGLHEYTLLNTCNRIELHAVGAVDEDRAHLLRRVLGFDRLTDGQYYLKQGPDAFEHTCALCAGLLSQMPGENHIAAQMKQALEASAAAGWAAGMMHEWMSAVFHVSKEARQAATPYLYGREIEDLAVDYLAVRRKDCDGLRLLVLGTGKTGAGFVEKVLARFPKSEIDWCYHRNCPSLPLDCGKRARLFDLDALSERLAKADVVVSAMTADRRVIASHHAFAFSHGRPVLLLDLAMPRNIDSSLGHGLPSITLVDLDGLKLWHRREQIALPRLRRLCGDLVLAHSEYYEKLITSFQGRNTEK